MGTAYAFQFVDLGSYPLEDKAVVVFFTKSV
jgi:hypothetical protein